MMAAIEVMSLAVIVWYSACGLNHMSRATRRLVVLAVALLFAGAVSRAWLVVTAPETADPSAAAILAAFALGMVANRRRGHNCPCLPTFARGDRRQPDRGANA